MAHKWMLDDEMRSRGYYTGYPHQRDRTPKYGYHQHSQSVNSNTSNSNYHQFWQRPPKPEDLPPSQRCQCCPYGYHIDLDFLRICDEINSGRPVKKVTKSRRSRSRPRQTSAQDIIPPPTTPTRSSSMPAEADRHRFEQKEWDDSMQDVFLDKDNKEFVTSYNDFDVTQNRYYVGDRQDYMRTRRQQSDNQSLPPETPDANFSDIEVDSLCSEIQESSHTGQRHSSEGRMYPHRYVSPETAPVSPLRRTAFTANLQDMGELSDSNTSISSTCSSTQSAPLPHFVGYHRNLHDGFLTEGSLSGRSTPSLSANMLATVRQQMAAALVRIRHLEEQAKHIPILQAKVNALKEEKRLLHIQLKNKRIQEQRADLQSSDPGLGTSLSSVESVSAVNENGMGSKRTLDDLTERLAEFSKDLPSSAVKPMEKKEYAPLRAIVTPVIHKPPRMRSVAVDATSPKKVESRSVGVHVNLLSLEMKEVGIGVHQDMHKEIHPIQVNMWKPVALPLSRVTSSSQTDPVIISTANDMRKEAVVEEVMISTFQSELFHKNEDVKKPVEYTSTECQTSPIQQVPASPTSISDSYTQTLPLVKKKIRVRETQTEDTRKEFRSVGCETFVEMKQKSTSVENLVKQETFSRGTLTDVTQMRHMAVNTMMTAKTDELYDLSVSRKLSLKSSVQTNTDLIETVDAEVSAVVLQSNAETFMDSSRQWDKGVGTTHDMFRFVGSITDAKVNTPRVITADFGVSCVIDVQDKGVAVSPLVRESACCTESQDTCDSTTSTENPNMVDVEVTCDLGEQNVLVSTEEKLESKRPSFDSINTQDAGMRTESVNLPEAAVGGNTPCYGTVGKREVGLLTEKVRLPEMGVGTVGLSEMGVGTVVLSLKEASIQTQFKHTSVGTSVCIIPPVEDLSISDGCVTSNDVGITTNVRKETQDIGVGGRSYGQVNVGVMVDMKRYLRNCAIGDSDVRIVDVAVLTDPPEEMIDKAVGDYSLEAMVCDKCVNKKMHSIGVEAKAEDILALSRRTIGTNHTVLTRSVGTGSSNLLEIKGFTIEDKSGNALKNGESFSTNSVLAKPALISRGVGESSLADHFCENCLNGQKVVRMGVSSSNFTTSISSQTDQLSPKSSFTRISPSSSIREVTYPATNPHERRRPRSHSFPKVVPPASLEGRDTSSKLRFPPPPDFSFLKQDVENDTRDSSVSADTIIKRSGVNKSAAPFKGSDLQNVDKNQGQHDSFNEGSGERSKPSKLEPLCSIEEDKLLATVFANPYFQSTDSSPVDTLNQTAANSKILDSQVSQDESTAASISSIASSSSEASETCSSSDDESSTTSYSTTEGSYDGFTGNIHVKRKRREQSKEQQKKVAQTAVKPQRVPLSPSSLKACKLINKHLAENKDVLDKDYSANVKNVLREWFLVSSQKSSEAAHVQGHLLSLAEVGTKVMHKIVNSSDGNGNTALHYSISHGNFSIVDVLLDSGVCVVDKTNKAGYTAIMLTALASIKDENHWRVVEKLFQMGDVNIKASQAGQTAIMLAVSHGKVQMVQLLMKAGANVNIQDEDGSTALMCASEHGHLDIVRLLLSQSDCDLSVVDNDNSSAFSIAMERGHKAIGVLLYAHMNFAKSSPKKRSTSSSPGSCKISPFLTVANPSPSRSASSVSLAYNHDNMQTSAQDMEAEGDRSKRVYLRSRSLSPSSRTSLHSLRLTKPNNQSPSRSSAAAVSKRKDATSSASLTPRSSSKPNVMVAKTMSISLSSLSVSSTQSGMSTSNTSISSTGSPSDTFQRGSPARSGSRYRDGGDVSKLAAAIRKSTDSPSKYKSV